MSNYIEDNGSQFLLTGKVVKIKELSKNKGVTFKKRELLENKEVT